MNGSYELYGRTYATFIFPSARSANNFMFHNKGWGVISYGTRNIHVAKCSDKGVKRC